MNDRPEVAGALLDRWGASGAPILRRLAVHGWVERLDRSADEKLRHVMEAQLLFAFATQHETYRLIEKCLPEASESRDDLLIAILAGPPAEHSLDDGINERLIVDLLGVSSRAIPDSHEFADALEQYQSNHADLVPSSSPGLAMTIESGFRSPYPVPIERLLEKTGIAEVEALFSAAIEGDPVAQATAAFDIPQALAAAAAQSPEWTMSLLQELKAEQEWDSPYWEPLVSGFSRSVGEIEQAVLDELVGIFGSVIVDLDGRPEMGPLLPPICDFLHSIVRLPELNRTVLQELELLGGLVSASVSMGPDGPYDTDPERIVDHAYNSWTGWLGRFWVGAISCRSKLDGPTWKGLSNTEKLAMEALLGADGERGVHPAAIFSIDFSFLLGADSEWAKDQLLPLFSWSNSKVATRTWSAFLHGGGWDGRAVSVLKPDLRLAFLELRGPIGKQLAERFGELMVRSTSDNFGDGTLGEFVAKADDQIRADFAASVGWWMHNMTPSYAEGVWERWINPYVTERLTGKPRKLLTAPEAGEMLRWITAAGRYFPEAVDFYLGTPAEFPHVTLFFRDIEDAGYLTTHTEALAQLLAFVLSRTAELYTCNSVGVLIGRLLDDLDATHRETLLQVCQHALRLGCGDAVSWRATLESKWPRSPSAPT